MPKIEIASSAGFCFGVERIVEMAEELVQRKNGRTYCLGELIHNPQEVRRLEAQGLVFIQSPDELPPLSPGEQGKVLIRAHGVAPKIKAAIKKKGYEVLDGTCPLVTIPHRFARQLIEEGYRLIIMGHIEHPEIQGILGELEGFSKVDVIPGPQAIEKLNLKPGDRVGLISQTTHPYERFAELVKLVLERVIEVKAFNTICQATFDRQEATRELAQRSDIVIVVGGRNSSNTNRLAEIAKEYTMCYHIESAEELKAEWFLGKERIGIAAGASTPDRVIRSVQEAITRIVGDEYK